MSEADSAHVRFWRIGEAVFGVALAAGLGWELALLVPSILLCHVVLIAPEEAYLERKFGAEYRGYRRSVRRWIGRSRAYSPRTRPVVPSPPWPQ